MVKQKIYSKKATNNKRRKICTKRNATKRRY